MGVVGSAGGLRPGDRPGDRPLGSRGPSGGPQTSPMGDACDTSRRLASISAARRRISSTRSKGAKGASREWLSGDLGWTSWKPRRLRPPR